jgi:rhodanese-related sulfurtransferase
MAVQELMPQPRFVGLEEGKRLFDARQAMFVDTRSHEAYEQSHVPGAIAMPLREVPRRHEELPRDRLVVFY